MRKVYQHSFCNVAASAAANGNEGCFRARETSLIEPLIIKSEWNDTSDQSYVVVDQQIWIDRVSWSVLAGRGWCFQERLLAPRVLHYGRNQILWECLETQACETYPKEIPTWFHGLNFKSLLSDEFGWQMIIESYMGAYLTKHEDKLIALSGIAQ